VSSVAFSPDGKYIVSGSGDETIKVWDIETGKIVKHLKAFKSGNYILFSPDGKYIISRSSRTIKIWKFPTMRSIGTLDVNCLELSPDGKYIITLDGKKIKILKFPSGKLAQTLSHTGSVTSVAFSPDGKYIVSGSQDKTIKVWVFESGELIHSLADHYEGIYSVKVSPDGKYIISGSDDTTVKLWDFSTGNLIRTLEGHEYCRVREDKGALETKNKNIIMDVLISPNEKYVLGKYLDLTIEVWELLTGKHLVTFEGYENGFTSIIFSPDSKYLIAGLSFLYPPNETEREEDLRFNNGDIEIYEVSTGRLISTFTQHKGWVNSIDVSPDGRFIVSGSEDKTVRVWDFLEIIKQDEEYQSYLEKLSIIEKLIEAESFSNAIEELSNLIYKANQKKYNLILNKAHEKLNLCKKLEKRRKLEKKKDVEIKKRFPKIEKLIQEMKFSEAVNELNDIRNSAKEYKLNEIINWTEKNLDLCEKLKEEQLKIEKINIIKKTILDLGIKFGRLQVIEIAEECGIENDLIVTTVKEMISNKEIYAKFFESSKSVAFDQQANIDEIDKLMSVYKDWEEKEVGKK